MKRIYSSVNPAEVRMMSDYLEQNNIKVKTEEKPFSMAMGEIPFTECYLGVWVEENDEARANSLIEAFFDNSNKDETWKCPHCSELLEAQFQFCWSCGTEKEGENE